MILLLRGHIRESFKNNRLYNLIKGISDILGGNLDIYIQTWNVLQSNVSWRVIPENTTVVDEIMIYTYFRDLRYNIRHILILDDSSLPLVGSCNGKVCSSLMPKRGWKNMWYGIYRGLLSISDDGVELHKLVLNTRFDILENFVPVNEEKIKYYVKNNMGYSGENMKFFINGAKWGVDNIYIGRLDSMTDLVSNFHFDLDDIMQRYPKVTSQEFLFYYENIDFFEKYKNEEPTVLNEEIPSSSSSISISRIVPINTISNTISPIVKPFNIGLKISKNKMSHVRYKW